MSVSRRTFLRASTAAAALASVPRRLPALASRLAPPGEVVPIRDDTIKRLAVRAIEAARSAGASYADIRLTRTRRWRVTTREQLWLGDDEELHAGVRAVVGGRWGFAAGLLWTPDEMARLGREAVAQGAANVFGAPSEMELGTVPVIVDEHWATPVEMDPFALPQIELADRLGGLEHAIEVQPHIARVGGSHGFVRQEKAFASSEGSYVTQVIQSAGSGINLGVRMPDGGITEVTLDALTSSRRGLEHVMRRDIASETARIVEETHRLAALPVEPVQAGRYPAVFDARSMIGLLHETLGPATELDRAIGQEANAEGTSWIGDPLAMMGHAAVASKLVTITGDRTRPGGSATQRWDDEGVPTTSFVLVKEGVLHDFQTTREGAGWLAERYAQRGQPIRSNACATSGTAAEPILSMPPNLTLEPGRERAGFDDLVEDVRDGIAVLRARYMMDHQRSSGTIGATVARVKRGRLTARVAGAGCLFRTADLWKSITALGGETSVLDRPRGSMKTEFRISSSASVRAVPAAVREVTVIELGRRA